MANKKIGTLKVNNTLEYEGKMPKGYMQAGSKTSKRELIYFTNKEKRTCTCIIKSVFTGKVSGIGISRCNPKDFFDLETGIQIAEYRAKIDEYQKNIKILGEGYGEY